MKFPRSLGRLTTNHLDAFLTVVRNTVGRRWDTTKGGNHDIEGRPFSHGLVRLGSALQDGRWSGTPSLAPLPRGHDGRMVRDSSI
jgi:hypothetical protein